MGENSSRGGQLGGVHPGMRGKDATQYRRNCCFTNELRKWQVQEATLIKMWFRNSPIRVGLLRNGYVRNFLQAEWVHVWKDYTGFTF